MRLEYVLIVERRLTIVIRKTLIVFLTVATVTTAGFWAGSYPLRMVYFESVKCPCIEVQFFRGRLIVRRISMDDGRQGHHTDFGFWAGDLCWGMCHSEKYAGCVQYVGLSLWFPFILFAVYPAVVIVQGPLRRWRRRTSGHCVKCGYNLKGNESGRCSECGAVITIQQLVQSSYADVSRQGGMVSDRGDACDRVSR
jgi:hypothetical protein